MREVCPIWQPAKPKSGPGKRAAAATLNNQSQSASALGSCAASSGNTPQMQESTRQLGAQAASGTAQDFAERLAAIVKEAADMTAAVGIKPQ